MRHAGARAQTEDSQSSPVCYEWKPQERPFSVQISLGVIDRLESDIMRGFWSVPKRGAEVGGVLFGRIAVADSGTVVCIEDYEAVESEHRRGPSYVLSDTDRHRLERTLRKATGERQVVGFFRSHTRLGLYLDQDDFALAQSYFPGPTQIFLLVRPQATGAGMAGFFFWEEEGNIHRQSTYLEFPFNRTELLKRNEGVKRREDLDAGLLPPAAATVPEEPAPAPPVRSRVPLTRSAPAALQQLRRSAAATRPTLPAVRVRLPNLHLPRFSFPRFSFSKLRLPQIRLPKWDPHRLRVPQLHLPQWQIPQGQLPDWRLTRVRLAEKVPWLRWSGWRFIGVAALGLLCFGLLEYEFVRFFSNRAVVSHEPDFAPELHVERNGGYLQLNWNRNSPAIRHGQRGLVLINDGPISKVLQLDQAQLRAGSVAYSPSTDEINFRLDVVGARATVSESLRVVESSGRPAAPVKEPQALLSSPKPESVMPARHAEPVRTAREVTAAAPRRTAKNQPQRHGSYDEGL